MKFSTRAAVKASNALSWNYGNFIQTVINFFVISACVFLIVKRKNHTFSLSMNLLLYSCVLWNLLYCVLTFPFMCFTLPTNPLHSVPDGQKYKDSRDREEMPLLLGIHRTEGRKVFEMHQLVGPRRVRACGGEPCQAIEGGSDGCYCNAGKRNVRVPWHHLQLPMKWRWQKGEIGKTATVS